jgi:hypothetical protein
MYPSRAILFLTALLLSASALAQPGRSFVDDGLLYVPRIDFENFGAMEMVFRLVWEGEYLLELESLEETLSSTSNAGVYNPLERTLELDEVQLETGEVYAVRLLQLDQRSTMAFTVEDAVLLQSPNNENGATGSGDTAGQVSAASATLYAQQCSNCHGADGLGTPVGPSLAACANCGSLAGLSATIRDTMPLGLPASCDAACADQLAAYIQQVFNADNQQVSSETVGFLSLLGNAETLRKAAMELGSRLPSLSEYQLVASEGEQGLRVAIQGMVEQSAFYERLTEIWNDYLLTDKYHSRNGSEAAVRLLSSDDFPDRRWFDPGSEQRAENYEELKINTNDGIAREPLALINYVVSNNLPFTQILTADYMMMNAFSARSYGVENLIFENPDDPEEFQPGRIADIPHAGILTSPMFLNRYPTTSTNRNRGRARVVYDLFLDTDILAIEGVRPGNAVDITTPIPTINNPECSKCHSILDPVASIFQNWDYKGRYRPARLSKYGWYSDMETRGFNGETMPLAGNIDSSVQWLAHKIAADPKFPRAVTRIMVNGLTGKEPLAAPVDAEASAADQQAYVAERTVLNEIQNKFVASDYNLKVLVEEILLSPYWRASGLMSDSATEAHELTGSTYLLSPEQLDRKIEALLGFEWRGTMDSYYKDKDRHWASKLGNTFHQIYGGIDSDSVTSRLRTPNGLMGAMQLRMANELACYAVPHDMWLPDSERRLFLYADDGVSPYNDSGYLDESALTRIRQNIQYLHSYLLGEDLPEGAAELQITEQLFMDVVNRGRQLILSSGGEWSVVHLHGSCDRTKDLNGESLDESERLRRDDQYVIRAWMAVVAYLLADYRFLYN